MKQNLVNFSNNIYYGNFGGQYIPELLMPAIINLSNFFEKAQKDPGFTDNFNKILQNYAGRPTPLTHAKRLQKFLQGPNILLKREDLLHTGAHKLNNALGQCLLAKKMGKNRIIAETGAGQHGVATATASAYLGLKCTIYMGKIDMERQAPNVAKMHLMGAEVVSVTQGSQTLKDAVNEALRDWAVSFDETHYCLGSALGPAPFPALVGYFQAVIGNETKYQCQNQIGGLPDSIIACIGGGSNAIGIFSAFLDDPVQLIGVEAGGKGKALGEHASRFQGGSPGILHGCLSYVLQDESGQIIPTHSISAGLDYPMIGPQHAYLYNTKRAEYSAVSDESAIAALKILATTEGIIPALESAHAVAYLVENTKRFQKNDWVVVNISGRGDKDLPQLLQEGII